MDWVIITGLSVGVALVIVVLLCCLCNRKKDPEQAPELDLVGSVLISRNTDTSTPFQYSTIDKSPLVQPAPVPDFNFKTDDFPSVTARISSSFDFNE